MQLEVAYPFVGEARWADLGACLRARADEFNTSATDIFGFAVNFQITEVDTLRGGSEHDLLTKLRQGEWCEKAEAGAFNVVVVTPPCDSYSSAVFANAQGPQPVRDFFYPRGLPQLPPHVKAKAEKR